RLVCLVGGTHSSCSWRCRDPHREENTARLHLGTAERCRSRRRSRRLHPTRRTGNDVLENSDRWRLYAASRSAAVARGRDRSHAFGHLPRGGSTTAAHTVAVAVIWPFGARMTFPERARPEICPLLITGRR